MPMTSFYVDWYNSNPARPNCPCCGALTMATKGFRDEVCVTLPHLAICNVWNSYKRQKADKEISKRIDWRREGF